ncbi:MAG: hypothetical protein WCY49_06705 [Anaerovoracaceae bacterium]
MLDVNHYFVTTLEKLASTILTNPERGLHSAFDFIRVFWVTGNHDQVTMGAKDLPEYLAHNQENLSAAINKISEFILELQKPPLAASSSNVSGRVTSATTEVTPVELPITKLKVGNGSGEGYPGLENYEIRFYPAELKAVFQCLSSYPLLLTSASEKKYAELNSTELWSRTISQWSKKSVLPPPADYHIRMEAVSKHYMKTRKNLFGEMTFWRALGSLYPFLPDSTKELGLLDFTAKTVLIVPRTNSTKIWVQRYGESAEVFLGSAHAEIPEVSNLVRHPIYFNIKGGFSGN